MKYFRLSSGFTLIELLIAVIVITILSAITVVGYNAAVDNAKTTQAKAELTELAGLIRTATARKGLPLSAITNSGWSMEYCVYNSANQSIRMDTLAKTDRCWTDYIAALNAIAAAAGVPVSDKLLDGDPWNAPYLIDENEDDERCNTFDRLSSAGKKNIPFQPGSEIVVDIANNFSAPC